MTWDKAELQAAASRWGQWMREWKVPEPPTWVMRRVREIQHAVPKAKPWDVWAWRGTDEVRFIEFKGMTEKLTDAELRFLYGAMKTGGAISAFAIVRGDITHPERAGESSGE